MEGLERTGHMVEYQCRSGYCGSCRVKILEEALLIEPPLAFLGRDEILPCCCCVEGDVRLDCGLAGRMRGCLTVC